MSRQRYPSDGRAQGLDGEDTPTTLQQQQRERRMTAQEALFMSANSLDHSGAFEETLDSRTGIGATPNASDRASELALEEEEGERRTATVVVSISAGSSFPRLTTASQHADPTALSVPHSASTLPATATANARADNSPRVLASHPQGTSAAAAAAATAGTAEPAPGHTAPHTHTRQRRSRHSHSDRPTRIDGGTPFFAASGGTSPSLPQPQGWASPSVSSPLQQHQSSAPQSPLPPQPQQEQQSKVYFSTQQQSPPACASSTTSSRDWVRLSVGGRQFVSTFATLCSDPNSVLAHICQPLLTSRRRAEGEAAQLSAAEETARHRRQQRGGGGAPATATAAGTTTIASSSAAASGGPSPMDDRAPGEASQSGEPNSASAGAAAVPAGDDGATASGSVGNGGGAAAKLAAGTGPVSDAGGGELANPGDPLSVAPLDVDEHNSILLDLDPDYFAPILNYLRHRTVIIPPSLSARGVLAVAEYLNVQGMVRQLAPERRVRRQVLSSWGSGGSGELGTQRFADSDVPTPVQVTPFGVKVTHMALGANYSCALSDDGNIYTFGNGDWGQLGLGPPKELDVHPDDKSAVVVVPRRVPLFERYSALHVSAGYAFAMAIIHDYHVYFWGNNNHGQSGLGPRFFDYNTRKVDEPKLVDTLEGKRIVQLGCGSFFSLALSEDGTLYSWGLIECLGLGTPDEVRRRYQDTDVLGESLSNEKRGVVLTPQVVTLRSRGNHRVVRIHAGQWHSGAINSAGELYTWGVGYQGRLGHGTKEPAYVPTRVRGALAGHRVVDVACGSFHTVAITDRGAVFCWGDNASGQCGTSARHAEAVTSPYRVVGLEFIAGGVAKGISCGRQHTVVVMEGPQPGCQGPCCQLDYRGRPYQAHAQVYTFGESARAGSGTANAGSNSSILHGTSGVPGSAAQGGVAGAMGANFALMQGGPGGSRGANGNGGRGQVAALLDTFGNSSGAQHQQQQAGVGVGGRTCSQYQLVPGLERMNVLGVVSGLHHTFVYAEEIETGQQTGGEEADSYGNLNGMGMTSSGASFSANGGGFAGAAQGFGAAGLTVGSSGTFFARGATPFSHASYYRP